MKVITASTPDQQAYVKELIENLYSRIFPCFFTTTYISELKDFELMRVPNLSELSLHEIMEVTAAIQTISTILETIAQTEEELESYNSVFKKSTAILNNYHIDFPFQLLDFQHTIVAEPNQKIH
ncbi:DUF5365 family protein [Radiobacillus sp. PE A8.2]|uniref:DUF5365 family protein n=1 Tax=Radiobacillus sp. PE A8.2 TaxID=3380349 RepID=UPI00388E8D66